LHLEKIKGRKSKALDEMINEPVIVEFKDGQIFGGYVDDYETGAFWLYDCLRLNKRGHEWKNHGIMTEFEGKEMEDLMPGFNVSAIKNIFTVKSDFNKEVSIEDALQFYIDPHHKPLLTIDCNYDPERNRHSPECDARLHEALICINTYGIIDRPDDDVSRKLHEAFRYVRRRFLMYGAKIP
jgi:hypothetical protein